MINVFPAQELVKVEEDIIADMLSHPTVKKYFHVLAYNLGRELVLDAVVPEESAEAYMRRQVYVKGQIAVLDLLLKIEAPISKEASST